MQCGSEVGDGDESEGAHGAGRVGRAGDGRRGVRPAQPARSGPAEPGGRRAAPSGAAAGTSSASGSGADLAACPARGAVLRIGGQLGNETFSAHPMENRFTSTLFSRLHQIPLFGADPQETKLDAAYGAAEAWEFQNDAQTLHVTLHDGLTFNNGTPVTAEDVAFSIDLAASDFADLSSRA